MSPNIFHLVREKNDSRIFYSAHNVSLLWNYFTLSPLFSETGEEEQKKALLCFLRVLGRRLSLLDLGISTPFRTARQLSRSFPDIFLKRCRPPCLARHFSPPWAPGPATPQPAQGGEPRGAAPPPRRSPATLNLVIDARLGLLSASRGCSEAPGWLSSLAWGPAGWRVPARARGEAELQAGGGWRARRRDPARQAGDGARAAGGRARGRGERKASPGRSGLVGWRPCRRSGCAPCSFWAGPRPPPPSSPPRRRCLRASSGSSPGKPAGEAGA